MEMSDDTYEDERLADVAEDVDVSGPLPLFGALDDDEFEWADDWEAPLLRRGLSGTHSEGGNLVTWFDDGGLPEEGKAWEGWGRDPGMPFMSYLLECE